MPSPSAPSSAPSSRQAAATSSPSAASAPSPDIFKLLAVGDQHFDDRPPSTRRDDYTEAIFGKLGFILAYALSKTIRNVLFLGDMFHRKRPHLSSHALVARLIRVLGDHQDNFEEVHGVRPRNFSLVGNHDIQYTLSRLDRQPINVLARAGVLELLDTTPISLEAGVELNGAPYGEATETDPAAYHLPIADPNSFKIWAFHSTLLPDGEQFYGSWVNFHQVADIAANVVLAGHYHPGFPTQEKHGKLWANPGALSRGSLDEHNLQRELRVLAFLRRSDGTFVHKDVPVPCAPAEEVFQLDTLRATRASKSNIAAFVDALDEGVTHHADVTTLEGIRAALTSMSKDKAAVARAMRYIDEAADELGA